MRATKPFLIKLQILVIFSVYYRDITKLLTTTMTYFQEAKAKLIVEYSYYQCYRAKKQRICN